MPPYTIGDLRAAWGMGRWVSCLMPDGSVGNPGEPGWESCVAGCVSGGPWRRVERGE